MFPHDKLNGAKMSSYFRALSLLCVHDNYISIIGYYTLASVISDIHAPSPRAIGPRAWSMYIGYCTSGGVITCLSLLKPYCTCTQHAIAQCYCIISKSPQGWSKPQSALRAEASDTQVATQPFCPWRRQLRYQKDVCHCHWRKVASQMYQPKC